VNAEYLSESGKDERMRTGNKTTESMDEARRRIERADVSPGPAAEQRHEAVRRSHRILRAIGNQGILNMQQAKRLQAKLAVSRPDDSYEQEADRVADAVMSMPDGAVSGRQSGVGSGNNILQTKPG
jgi:hypothetical protein